MKICTNAQFQPVSHWTLAYVERGTSNLKKYWISFISNEKALYCRHVKSNFDNTLHQTIYAFYILIITKIVGHRTIINRNPSFCQRWKSRKLLIVIYRLIFFSFFLPTHFISERRWCKCCLSLV